MTALLVLTAASPALGASTCSYSNGTVTASGDSVLGLTLAALPDKQLQFAGVDCGAATTDNTTAITVDTGGTGSIGLAVSITVDVPLERDGAPIKVSITNGGSLRYEDRSDRGTAVTVAMDASGRPALQLGGDEAPDVTFTDSKEFRTVTVLGGPGADVLTSTVVHDVHGHPAVELDGQAGPDSLGGAAALMGSAGDDTMRFSAQGSALHYGNATSGVRMRADLGGTEPGFDGFGGADTYVDLAQASGVKVTGSAFGDSLQGGRWAASLWGDDGDDVFAGLVDNVTQTVQCGDGTDTGVADDGDFTFACEFSPPPAATLSVDTTSAHENEGFLFTVTLDRPLPFDTSFGLDYDGTDLWPGAGGTVPAGQLSATIRVWAREDQAAEPAETVTVQLSRRAQTKAPRIGSPGSVDVTVLDGPGPDRSVPAGATTSMCPEGSELSGVVAQLHQHSFANDFDPEGVLSVAARCRDGAGALSTAGYYPRHRTLRESAESSCAPGDGAKGLVFRIAEGARVTSDDYIGAVGIGCASGDGPMLGTTGGTPERSECPPGDPIVGIKATTAEPEDFAYYVGTVAAVCRSGLVVGPPTTTPPTTPPPTTDPPPAGGGGGTIGTPPPPPVLPAKPSLSRVEVDRLTGSRKGRLRFRLDVAAVVRVEIFTVRSGRRSRGRCSTSARRGKRCTTQKPLGKAIAKAFAAGAQSLTLSRSALKSGRYRLVVTPTGLGGTGAARTVSFTVKGRRR